MAGGGIGEQARRRSDSGRSEHDWHGRVRAGGQRAELRLVQRQELQWLGKGGADSNERRIRWKQRQVQARAMRAGIWQQRQRGQAGEREGSAPASLCRRQVRAAGAGWGHSPRYWRLGGGGKQGWVT